MDWKRIITPMLFLISVISCGSDIKPQSSTNIVDKRAHLYYNEFELVTGLSPWDVALSFMAPPLHPSHPTAIGMCNNDGSITVNTEWWDASPNSYCRESLIFHELGHCLLGLRHDQTRNNNNKPVSIMYPIVIGCDPYYAIHRQSYMNDIINRIKPYGEDDERTVTVNPETERRRTSIQYWETGYHRDTVVQFAGGSFRLDAGPSQIWQLQLEERTGLEHSTQ